MHLFRDISFMDFATVQHQQLQCRFSFYLALAIIVEGTNKK